MITQRSDAQQRFRKVDRNSDPFQNAILAVLASAGAKEVIRYKSQVGRGKVYWVYYGTNKGKRRATFISPKEFKGYRWFDDFSTVVNLESGAVYEVSSSKCTCPSWKYQVKAGKKEQCKHQAMRSEHVGVNLSSLLPSSEETNSDRTLYDRFVLKSNPYKLNPNVLDRGLSFERSDDYTYREYYLKAWSLPNRKTIPVQKRIGRIIETDDGFMVAGMRGMARAIYKLQRDAINWILNYNGISLEQIKAAYIESQQPIKPQCDRCGNELKYVGWITEPDLCPNCGWVEKKLTERELRRLAREEKAEKPNVVSGFGGFF